MGIYDRDYYRREGPSLLDRILPDGRVCRWLIGLNIGVFVLQLVLPTVTGEGRATSWPMLWLELNPTAVKGGEVWRLLTYAFLHDPDGILHIFFNMLFLWWFGADMESRYGSREFCAFYLVSALLGGIGYQAWAMANHVVNPCIGASGAVTAVLILYACHFPQRIILVMLILPVPIWLFAVFGVAQDVYRVMHRPEFSPVAAVVHLTGAAFGFLYYQQRWRILNWLPDFTLLSRRRSRANLRVYRPDESEREPVPVATTAPTPREIDEHLEAKVDAVLEKVSRHGQGSLTAKERAILMRASEIYRRKRT